MPMERKYKIIKNSIKCKICGQVLESKSRHDFQACKCFNESGGTKGCFCDGGNDYIRIGGNLEEIENLSITRPYTDEERDEYNKRQIQIAGEYGWAVDLME